MSTDNLAEARRQLEICNACRYCEGYCSVFPGVHRRRAFSDPDIKHLANLCHNCRGCFYACQYTAPHEFALNLPAILAGAQGVFTGGRHLRVPRRTPLANLHLSLLQALGAPARRFGDSEGPLAGLLEESLGPF